MAKFIISAMATGIAMTAIFAAPASAQSITNEKECQSEGGTMVKVKGSDFCLVPIRPEAYRDPIYDGNQLGVTECPGNKLNDGLYCMYPVTVNSAAMSRAADEAAKDKAEMKSQAAKEMADEASN